MPYRVEDSPNARAGCKNKECKDTGEKIQKGELRFGSQVTIKEHTTWAYKHWGCVTPAQIANWSEENGGDPELIDGYDELCPESKAKVDYALEHGHVADEDWKGDVEVNRPGQKGFRAKASKAKGPKKGKKNEEDDEEQAEAPKAQVKRGRAKREDDEVEDEAPAPKKARGKKAAPKEIEKDDTDEPDESELPKAKRAKKAAPKKEIDEDDAADVEPKPPKSKRGKKATVPDSSEKPVPQKRSARKKAAVNYEED